MRLFFDFLSWVAQIFGANRVQELQEEYRDDATALIEAVKKEVEGIELPPDFQKNLDEIGAQIEALGPEQANAQFNEAFSGIRGELGGLQSQFETGATGINRRFDTRTANLLSQLQGYGSAERADLNRQFTEAGLRSQQQLQERGLGTSTLLANARTGTERERASALGLFEERLRGQKIGLQERTTLSALEARREQNRFGADLGLRALKERRGIREFGLNFRTDAARQQVDDRFRLTELGVDAPLRISEARIRGLSGIEYRAP